MMARTYVELSQESLALATAEALAAAEVIGGRRVPESETEFEAPMLAVDLPGPEAPARWAGRLALARRCLVDLGSGDEVAPAAARAGTRRDSASFRRLGHPSAADGPLVRELGTAYKEAGGTIDLEQPRRRFWIASDRRGVFHLLEEVSAVDRAAVAHRRMPQMPFQRPVSLPPRLARGAANLARVAPGGRVLDPFLGTGALLLEAGLLGARLYGIDRDATMVRGAIRNLEFVGVTAEELLVGDAGAVEFSVPSISFDAILTDPPYGRSSSTGGEGADALVRRVLPRWADRVVPGGRVVLVVPSGSAPIPGPWELRTAVPVRVHRSLTREFRVYERRPSPHDERGLSRSSG